MDDQKPPKVPKPLPNRTQYMADMDNFVPPVKPKHILSGLLRIILILIIIVAVIGAGVWALKQHKANKPTLVAKTPSSSTSAQSSSVAISTKTKHYDSTNYNLGFDYPSDWTVNDQTAKLTVTSPVVSLRTAGNETTKDRIVLTIQNPPASITEFSANTATAPIASQKLTYKSPTPNQRAQTYLTAVSYSGSATEINAFYITGDFGYSAGQYVPQADIIKANPLITLGFYLCGDGTSATCDNPGKPTALTTTAWSDASLSKPLITLLQSLVLN